jgi:hypothetical protein
MENGAEVYKGGVEVTLTTAPHARAEDGEHRNAGIEDEVENLVKAKEGVLNKLCREAHDRNLTPHHVDFLEFCDSGVPHMHLEVFGIGKEDLPSEEEIERYTSEEQNHCEHVELNSIYSDGFEWKYSDSGIPVLNYQLQSIRTLLDMSEGKVSPYDDPFDDQNSTKAAPWKMALYWGVYEKGCRFVYGSTDLLNPLEDGPKFKTRCVEKPETESRPLQDLRWPERASSSTVEQVRTQNDETPRGCLEKGSTQLNTLTEVCGRLVHRLLLYLWMTVIAIRRASLLANSSVKDRE